MSELINTIAIAVLAAGMYILARRVRKLEEALEENHGETKSKVNG